MYVYKQSTGQLLKDEIVIAVGYAGRDAGKNNPAMQNVKGVGPLPCGDYTIGPAYDHPTVGKYAMPLTPDPSNEMFGRTSFFIHGDSKSRPGTASHGCICVLFIARKRINEGTDRRLRVIA